MINEIENERQPALSAGKSKTRLIPNRYGVLLLVIIISMLIGSLNYNNNPGFLLTFLLGGMAFISIFTTLKNIAGMEIKALPVKPVFAGETVDFEFMVVSRRNSSRAVQFSLKDSRPSIATRIRKNIGEKIRVQLKANERGIFDPGPLRIGTKYPLGVFEASIQWKTQTTGLVYPVPISGPAEEPDGPVDEDGNNQVTGTSPGDFSELRAYIPGDPMQRIAWKASQRGQGLLTKDFTEQVNTSVILDFNNIPGRDVEYRLSRLCHMVLESDRKEAPYGLRLVNKTIKPGSGELHKRECLNALAVF